MQETATGFKTYSEWGAKNYNINIHRTTGQNKYYLAIGI